MKKYRGELEEFPDEIVEKMLENQLLQGNLRDKRFVLNDKDHGGFLWADSPEGHDFWEDIIDLENFSRFYVLYPKKDTCVEPSKENITEDFFKRAYTSLCKMQQEKNKRYGEAALEPLNIFGKFHQYGKRIDEKLKRIQISDKPRKNDFADVIGGIMLLCKEYGWDNFEDLID